jgi:hypothetical protein
MQREMSTSSRPEIHTVEKLCAVAMDVLTAAAVAAVVSVTEIVCAANAVATSASSDFGLNGEADAGARRDKVPLTIPNAT